MKDAVAKAKTGAEKLKTLNQQTMIGLTSHAVQARVPNVMPQALSSARHDEPLVLVGGSAVGGAPLTTTAKRRSGHRCGDKKKRKSRRCTNCVAKQLTDQQAQACPGAHKGLCNLEVANNSDN